jgi:4-hydroxybutyrate CoA-transferase
MKFVTADAAVAAVESGHRVYLHGGAATPTRLVEALIRRAPQLERVEIVHLHSEAPAPYLLPGMVRSFRHNALFIGPNARAAVEQGIADYTPCFLSEIPSFFAPGGQLPLDVALIQVTPPDAAGNCSLGISVDVALAAAESARVVVAQVNPSMPRTHGAVLPASLIDFAFESDEPLHEHLAPGPTEVTRAIGRKVAELVTDGATLQLGIGAIPDAALEQLTNHRHLGVHTEMFSDGLVPLIERGVVDGARKTVLPGIAVTSFVIGTQRLYGFVKENPAIEFHPVDYTNNVPVIAANHRMTAINSALSVDLTGQVAADGIGPRFYSGIGGQVDFIRGAAQSQGGVPVIALPSTAADGAVSRICGALAPASGVVTTRGDVHWVVTEYGACNLHGRSIRERARMLIDIAHPAFRAALEAEAGALGYLRTPGRS